MNRTILEISAALFAVALTASIALANWQQTFLSDYSEQDLNIAVKNALAEGISPLQIAETAMAINGMTGEVVTAAVCDGGVAVQHLQDSLKVLQVDQQTAINICETIPASGRFPSSDYSSVSKRTNYDGSNNRVQPASGHNFNQ